MACVSCVLKYPVPKFEIRGKFLEAFLTHLEWYRLDELMHLLVPSKAYYRYRKYDSKFRNLVLIISPIHKQDEDLYFVAPESSLSCSGEESTVKAGGMGRDSTSGISYHRHSTTMRLKPDEEGPFEEEDGSSELEKDEIIELEEYEDGKEDNGEETVI